MAAEPSASSLNIAAPLLTFIVHPARSITTLAIGRMTGSAVPERDLTGEQMSAVCAITRQCRVTDQHGRRCRQRRTAQIDGSPVRYGSTGTSAGTDTCGTGLNAAAASHPSPPSRRRVEPSPRIATRP